MKRVPKIVYLALAVLIAVGGVAAVLALDILDPTDTWNVTPVSLAFPESRTCPTGSTLISDQFQSVTQGVLDGTASATYTVDGKEVTVNLVIYPDNSIDFEVVGGVMPQMFVKGGGASYLLYQYEPPVSGATNSGPVTFDTSLHDGVNPNNENEYQDISHLDFCIIPKAEPLTATKTAYGSFDRTVEWDLTKSVDTLKLSGLAGETAGDVTWEVVATKSETLDNYQVIGVITVTNSNNFAVPFTVSDQLNDGTLATINCPSSEVAANSIATCSYTAVPADDGATMNTAVVTSGDPRVDGAIAEAAVSFSENLIGYDEGMLSDERFGFSEAISATTTKTFEESFTCPADVSLYTNGSYTFTEINTAILDGNIGLEASAEVEVTCVLKKLVPSKTAAGSYDRTVEWDLEKTVAPDSHIGFAGQDAGSSTWNVVATKTETLSNYKVAGEIIISNPAAIAQSFTIGDVLDDGTVATVTCPDYTIPAGGTVTCTYEALPNDASATLNTATVTAVGNPAQTVTAQVAFTEKLVGYDTGTLSDPRFEYSEVISGDTTVTFLETFTCPADAILYEGDGHFQFTETNTAYLNDNIDLEDSAQVKVDCYAPVVSKDAAGTFDKTYKWDVEKTVDPIGNAGMPGDTLGWTWTVIVTKIPLADSNFAVSGTISITNPHPTEAMTVALADVLSDGTVANIEYCATPAAEFVPIDGQISVPALTKAVCHYTASPTTKAELNTVTATFNAIDFAASAEIVWTGNESGGSAVLDDNQNPAFPITITEGGTWTYSDSHTCSSKRSAYDEVTHRYIGVEEKTAIITWDTGVDSSTAKTSFTCKAGFVDLIKKTNGVEDEEAVWTFNLYKGGYDGELIASGTTPPTLLFADLALPFYDKYTVCELGTPAGWSSIWTMNGVGVTPYNPDAPEENLGNLCVDFYVGTTEIVDGKLRITGPTTINFVVDNISEGDGDPRTPGYWKNWNTCSGGGQEAAAARNGGWAEGFWLLDDVLGLTDAPSEGILWDDILADEFIFPIDSCDLGVAILNTRDFDTGKQMAGDVGYRLAKHLLAAQANFIAGACTTPEALAAAVDAEALLDKYDFDAIGASGIGKKGADFELANMLAGLLDQYNNGMFCGSTYMP